jgi:hypothetical protein
VHADSEIARWAVILLAFTMRLCSQNMLKVHQAMWFLGNIFAQQGADDEALSILTVALEGFTWMDVHCSRAECMQTLGEVHFKHGEFHMASIFWMEARPLFERSLQAQAVVEIDCKLVDLGRHLEGNLKPPFKPNVLIAPLQQVSAAPEAPVHKKEDK